MTLRLPTDLHSPGSPAGATEGEHVRRGSAALLLAALALGGAGCSVNQTTPQGDPANNSNIQQTDHGLIIKNSGELQQALTDAVNRHVISQQKADATLNAYNVTLSQTGNASKATTAANNALGQH